PDYGVDLPLARELREVAAVLLKRLERVLGRLAGDVLATPYFPHGVQHAVTRYAEPLELAFELARRVRDYAQKEMLRARVLVPERLCLLLGGVERLAELAAEIDLVVLALHLRQLRDLFPRNLPQRVHVHAELAEDLRR